MTAQFGDNGGPVWSEAELAGWDSEDLAYVEWQARWRATRRDNQIEPEGDDWVVWNILAGRGFGKTRTGAETIGNWAILNPNTRWLVAAPTAGDLRSVCFEGESGLVNVVPPELIEPTKTGNLYNSSLFEMTVRCIGGGTSLIKGISADEPERFRGPQFHGGWLDELAAWKYLQMAWDMIMFTMRLGERPRLVLTTTPRPKPLISQLADNKLTVKTVTTRGSSRDNFKNLAPTYRDQLLQYDGTQLGRQEIEGEILDAEEGGVIKRSWFNLWPSKMPLPAFDEIVLSLDTAMTEEARNKQTGDPDFTACTVWGVFSTKPIGSDKPAQINIMLLDAWSERLGFPDLLVRVKEELQARYGGTEQKPVFKPAFGPPNLLQAGRQVDTVVIEDKGSGISLRQSLAAENIFAVPYNPGRADKLARLHGVSHIANAGILYLWESEKNPGKPRDWCEPMLAQVCVYQGKGTTEHDDYVDTFSQAIRYITDKYRIRVTPKPKVEDDVVVKPKSKANPYAT